MDAVAGGSAQGTQLRGRARECAALDELIAAARRGESGALVLRGEAGIGKTALLRYAAQQASDLRVAQIAGIEAEMELPFSALHQLCAPMLARADDLPEPQSNALNVAFGLAAGSTPDRFLIALATLSLVSLAGDERALCWIVDDAQWLDDASIQVLGVVARRLLAERVAIVFAIREPFGRPELDGLPQLRLEGLDDPSALALLARAVPGRIDDGVRDRIVAEARGNPLALLELPRVLSASDLAGGFRVAADGDLSGRLETQFAQRLAALPAATQTLVLLAAADPVGDATLLWRAARRLAIEPDALAPAQDADLLEIGHQVRFRHPLVRSAVYRAAPHRERQRVHRALAEEIDPDRDADRRAWHRALAAAGADETVAAELESSAGRAETRGGIAAAAAFFERAAALSVDPSRGAGRALAAAHAKHEAGANDAALALLATAVAGPLDPLERARAEVLGARIELTSRQLREAPGVLLGAAQTVEALDPTLARETYLDALTAVQWAGRVAGDTVLEVAQAARRAPAPDAPLPSDLLLDGLALLISDGYGAAAPVLRQALDAFRTADLIENRTFRWLWAAQYTAIALLDVDAWRELSLRELEFARADGMLTKVTVALGSFATEEVFAGELTAAASLIEEQDILREATQTRLGRYAPILLAAWRGQEAELAALTTAKAGDSMTRGEGFGVSVTQHANAVLYNGLRRYEEALAAALALYDPPRRFDAALHWGLSELVEAAARCDRPGAAEGALGQLVELTSAVATDVGLGLQARCRALLSDRTEADPLYHEAIERLGRTRMRPQHARAHLVYGEWLRREDRRAEAREHLHVAYDMFAEMGVDGFAERARRELQATGETVRKPKVETHDDLTAQEAQIARLARDGLSNPEIGSQLFLSARTVEWHLHKVFTKLAIRSRRELAVALPAATTGVATI